jgi:lipopolysaccharide heptosyltransferase II
MTDYRRILIIKPSSLGDVVHALPTLAALRERYPKAHIAWFVKQRWAGLLERAEGLDAVWPVEPTLTDWLREILRLRRFGFDLVIDLQGLLRSGMTARLTGCPTRVGFANAREGSPWCYTHHVRVPSSDMHAVDRYLLIPASLGATPRVSPEFRLRVQPGDGEEVAKLLARHGLKAGAAWIAMNVAARWPTKRWPPESFAAAADQIHAEGLGSVVLLGGPEDREVARAVKERMRTVPIDLTGATTPGLLPALLGAARLLLTNDSGPMHVAVAVGTPVVALFGPTSAGRTGPYGAGHRVLSSGVPCSPCFSRVCRNAVELECLRKIFPDQVLEAVRGQLAQRPTRGVVS